MSFTCELCNRNYTKAYNLYRHKRDFHENIRNHSCQACSSFFTSKSYLNNHIKLVHSNTRDFKCNLCIKEFGTNSHLIRHTNAVHNNNKPFQCSFCGKSFSENSNLRQHISTVHEHTQNFQCQFCNVKFSFGSNLLRHIHFKHINVKETSKSRPEMSITNILERLNVRYYREQKFSNLLGLKNGQLRFDFAIPVNANWLLIECDGIQHFEATTFGSMTEEEALQALKVYQAHDRIKCDFCLINNYPLLRLSAKHLSALENHIVEFIKSHSSLLDFINLF